MKLTDQDLKIIAAVMQKSAVELIKNRPEKTLSFDEMAEAVDMLSRKLFVRHVVWLDQLIEANNK